MKDSTQRLQPTYSLEEERLNALKQILPEAFADGKINFDTLRELLGDDVEDERDEHFGLSWTGKREARRLAGLPSKGTLVPVAGEGVDEATTENIFIEGDNLEVLKLLHKSYRGKIKMIYIDPPYNTGNDFIYKDDYREPLESYLERSGQMTEAGELLSSNPKSEGRFHSNWLNMIYPRLRVAKDLLRDDGVIFVSIDDNEVQNLRHVMNEIFGEEHFLACIAWEKRFTRSNNARLFYSLKDSILVYRKSELITYLREGRTDKSDSIYSNPDNDQRGVWTSSSYVNPATKNERPNLVYDLTNPFTGEVVYHPTHAWKYERNEYLRHTEENRLWWGKDGSATYPRLKNFLSDSDGLVPIDLWDYKSTGTTDEGGYEVKELFNEAVFDNPKPTKLIQRMLRLITNPSHNEIILDFFGGSGTTSQAVLNLNQSDKGNRKFILVQIPEKTGKGGFEFISDVTKERIRRAIKKIKSERNGNSPLLQQAVSAEAKQDLGFKVFRLERSNFRAWTDFTGQELSDFRPLLEAAESPFVSEASPDGILTEILLLEGFPLNSKTEIDPAFERNKVTRVSSEFSEHRLFITLDEEVWEETIDHAAELEKNDIFICLDNALSDENKVRLADVCRLKTI